MDDFFTSHSIYKSLIIFDTEENGRRLLQELIDEDHSVAYVTPPSSEDTERPVSNYKFRQFATGATRVLMMSYATWYELVNAVETYAMDHNLLVLHGLDRPEENLFMTWLLDARQRGFLTRSDNYHIVIQEA
jgi:hypothetical protein